MFVTHAPCIECAKALFQSGIRNVYYRDTYRNDDGVKFLEKLGVDIQQINNQKTIGDSNEIN
jgi:dCMP deaminase